MLCLSGIGRAPDSRRPAVRPPAETASPPCVGTEARRSAVRDRRPHGRCLRRGRAEGSGHGAEQTTRTPARPSTSTPRTCRHVAVRPLPLPAIRREARRALHELLGQPARFGRSDTHTKRERAEEGEGRRQGGWVSLETGPQRSRACCPGNSRHAKFRHLHLPNADDPGRRSRRSHARSRPYLTCPPPPLI